MQRGALHLFTVAFHAARAQGSSRAIGCFRGVPLPSPSWAIVRQLPCLQAHSRAMAFARNPLGLISHLLHRGGEKFEQIAGDHADLAKRVGRQIAGHSMHKGSQLGGLERR